MSSEVRFVRPRRNIVNPRRAIVNRESSMCRNLDIIRTRLPGTDIRVGATAAVIRAIVVILAGITMADIVAKGSRDKRLKS